MKLFNASLFVTLVFISSNALSHESVKNYNQISLEVTASSDVKNDTMIISLYAQEEGSKAAEQSKKVNKKINWALQQLKSYKDIKVETESYTTNPVYNKSQVVAWRVKQSLKLESTNMSLMSDVLGVLQQQLNLNGIAFDVSRDKREQETKSLIDQALAAYNTRAKQIANKLRRDHYKIVTMNVSTTSNVIQPRFRHSAAMMSESASMVAPTMVAGEKTLNVRVNGTIELE